MQLDGVRQSLSRLLLIKKMITNHRRLPESSFKVVDVSGSPTPERTYLTFKVYDGRAKKEALWRVLMQVESFDWESPRFSKVASYLSTFL